MKIFENYAGYYDLLYRDKDYTREADFVHKLIQKHFPGTYNILELGCGTGAHGERLIAKGYCVHGVDLSDEMLERAMERVKKMPSEEAKKLTFSKGDIRRIRLNKKFDAVISLFHVMSYQTTNDDLHATLAAAQAQLNPGGIFVFDFWYGPAVLTDRPVVKVKRLEDKNVTLTRIAEPEMRPNENLVDVKYHVYVKDRCSGEVKEVTETHCMRYFFKPEIEKFCSHVGLECLECREWLTDREPGFDTWSVYVVGRNTITDVSY